MICARCGAQIPEGARVCPSCGMEIRPGGTAAGSQRGAAPGAGSGQPQGRWQQQQYGYRSGVQQPKPGKGYGGSGGASIILGSVAALSAVLVFISTFITWLHQSGVFISGISLMSTTEMEGFFMIRWGWGGMVFTGFFSLLLGAVMIIPVILLYLNKRSGASWSIVTGVFGFFIALANIILIFTTFPEGSRASAGAGLYLMLAFSVGVLVCGIVGMRYTQ